MDPGVAKPGLLMLRRRAGSLPFSVHVSYRSLTQLAGYSVAKVEVTSRTTVAELKERLGTAVSLSVANLRLFYGGLELQEGATVGDCGINAASCDHATAQRCGQSLQRQSAAEADGDRRIGLDWREARQRAVERRLRLTGVGARMGGGGGREEG